MVIYMRYIDGFKIDGLCVARSLLEIHFAGLHKVHG
jgi:hypothetical protein